jgi:2-methylcitrate dehydratase
MTSVEQMADFTLRMSEQDLPPEMRQLLKRNVLDSLGCAIGAIGTGPIRAIRSLNETFYREGPCTLIGGGRTTPDQAAFHNGAMIRYLEFMDGFLAKRDTSHPSDNLAALLAVGELADRSGLELMLALAIAYQIQCRFTEEAPVMSDGFSHTAHQAFSVAAGVSRLLGLDLEKTVNALAISGSNALELAVVHAEPVSQWKGLSAADAGMRAVHHSLLAQRGITGPLGVFEGPSGLDDVLGRQAEIDWAHERLDVLPRTSLNRYEAEILAQSAIQWMLELRELERIRPADVQEIKVEIFFMAYQLIGGGRFGPKTEVRTKEQADHSLPYLLAVALLDGQVGPEQYQPERIARGDVQDLLRKVTIKPSTAYSIPYPREMRVRINVVFWNRCEVQRERSEYDGFFRAPMGWRDVLEKFDRLAKPHADAQLRSEIISAVENLEKISVAELMRPLAQIGAKRIEKTAA